MNAQTQPPSTNYIPYLTVLKFLASLAVVATHISDFPWWRDAWGDLWLCAARFGSAVFIMVSGALILRTDRPMEIVPFYRRRLPHLFIPLVVWSLIFYWFFHPPPDFDFRKFAAAFFADKIAGHLWFMYVIIALYVAAPFLLRMLRHAREREIILFLALCLVFSSFAPLMQRLAGLGWPFRTENTPFGGLVFYFVAGHWLARVRPLPRRAGLTLALSALGFILAAALTYRLALDHHATVQRNSFYLERMQFNIVLLAVSMFVFVRSLPLGWLRWQALLRAITATFYGIYLMHPLVVNVVRLHVERRPRQLQWFGSALWGVPLLTLLVYGIAAAIALVLLRIPLLRRAIA